MIFVYKISVSILHRWVGVCVLWVGWGLTKKLMYFKWVYSNSVIITILKSPLCFAKKIALKLLVWCIEIYIYMGPLNIYIT